MTDPEQLAALDGQQYLVLRPGGAVSDAYRATQTQLLRTTPQALKHPHTEHVTLRGFSEPERRTQVISLVRRWAALQAPIEIGVDAIDTFAAPWQIVIMRLQRTASLVSAYTSLTDALDATNLQRLDELSIDEWIFHLSLVYGTTLAPEAWADLARAVGRMRTDQPACVITEAELVWYAEGRENHEIIPLG